MEEVGLVFDCKKRKINFVVEIIIERKILFTCKDPVLVGRPLLLPLTRFEGGFRVSGFEDKDPEDGIEAKLLVPVLDGGPDCR